MDTRQLYPLKVDFRQGYAFSGATSRCPEAFHDEFQTASRQGYALTAARLSFMAQLL